MTSFLQMRNIFALVILFTALVNLVLGGLVIFDSPRRKINRLFCLLCVTLFVWGISFIGYNLSRSMTFSLLWARLYAVSLLFVPPIFYHMILGGVGNPLKGRESDMSGLFERLKQLAYVFSIGWFVLMARSMTAQVSTETAAFAFPTMGQQFWIAAVAYTVLMGVAITLLSRQLSSSKDPSQKSRLIHMLMGTTAIVIAGIFTVLLTYAVHFHAPWLVTVGHLSSTLCMALIAYSLTTSHLYRLSELLRKTLAFIVMTIILLVVFGTTHFLSAKLLLPYIPRSDFFALGMASIIMALLFHPLRYRVQNLVDRIFFTQQYDQMQRLRGLSRRVLSSADRDELLNILFSSLKSIGFHSMSLLLKDPQKAIFHIRKSNGLSPNAEGFFLRTDSLLIQHVREEKGELIRDEVTRRILTDWERQAISDEMEVLQAEICFPLFSTRRRALFGVITLGNSDLGYSSYKGRNIFWLKSVIDNAGIMLDNFYHQEFANALVPYVGRTWATEMRRNKEGFRERLAGYRTWVSVLMVDIRHFTPLTGRLDPREVVDLLKDFRSRVAPIVYRHQGTIDKFIGDAVMIVFGLPILPHLANPDKNAVECSLDIMREIENMNEKRFQAGHKEAIAIGIGVSSGEVIAGNVDSGDRVEYTVIGDAANMVARIEDLAGDNQILLSPATYHRVKEVATVKAWKPRYLTGFDEPVVIYELLSLLDASSALNPKDVSSSGQIAVNE